MGFNIDRLRAAVAWAEVEWEKDRNGDTSLWDQTFWAYGEKSNKKRKPVTVAGDAAEEDEWVELKCGSTACVAGWVCANEGDKFVALDWQTPGEDGKISADFVIPKGTREAYYIDDRAMELLGITRDEADALFDGENTIEDVKRVAREIAEDRGETL